MQFDIDDYADDFESFEPFTKKPDANKAGDRNRNKNRQIQKAKQDRERQKKAALDELSSTE